jgi:hypothetical protein
MNMNQVPKIPTESQLKNLAAVSRAGIVVEASRSSLNRRMRKLELQMLVGDEKLLREVEFQKRYGRWLARLAFMVGSSIGIWGATPLCQYDLLHLPLIVQ